MIQQGREYSFIEKGKKYSDPEKLAPIVRPVLAEEQLG